MYTCTFAYTYTYTICIYMYIYIYIDIYKYIYIYIYIYTDRVKKQTARGTETNEAGLREKIASYSNRTLLLVAGPSIPVEKRSFRHVKRSPALWNMAPS